MKLFGKRLRWRVHRGRSQKVRSRLGIRSVTKTADLPALRWAQQTLQEGQNSESPFSRSCPICKSPSEFISREYIFATFRVAQRE